MRTKTRIKKFIAKFRKKTTKKWAENQPRLIRLIYTHNACNVNLINVRVFRRDFACLEA